MTTFLTVLHISVCVFLVVIVLLQHGKGADIGATFGGASQTVFGARGAATFLSKLTAGMAVTFMLTSLLLAYLSAHQSTQTVFSAQEEAKSETPAKEPEKKSSEGELKRDQAGSKNLPKASEPVK